MVRQVGRQDIAVRPAASPVPGPRPTDPDRPASPDRPAAAHRARQVARAAWQAVAGVVYPDLCLGCDTRLPSESADGLPLCAACLRGLPRVPPADAYALLAATGAPVLGAVALWAYDDGGTVRRVQHALKYGGQPRLGRPLGALVGRAAVEAGVEADVVVPVPLSRVRHLERGYNQAAALAEGVAAALGAALDVEALVRTRPTASQTRLAREERAANVAGAFRAPHPERVAGRRVLLVDDVLTTGATLAEAARTLADAGATVSVAAMARAE